MVELIVNYFDFLGCFMQNILKTVRQAVQQYEMIAEGDKIAVGISGGKDSLVLLLALNMLSKFYPKRFEVVGITIDQRFEGVDGDFSGISALCDKEGIEYKIEKTDIWEIVFKERKEENPCSLCSRMRKGALYDAAKKHGCNKVALGHHLDDAVVTFYMNLLNNGTLGCFSPLNELPEKGITVIRPLCLTDERNVIHVAKVQNVPIVESRCTVNGETERAKVEAVIKALGENYKNIKEKSVGAMQRAHLSNW